jgi:pimeloyl-ACP methyl ester carboxylesterase
MVPVEPDVSISCRFYPVSPGSPCILYFHGNGEVACEHDWIASLYNREGIGLFVADYRGYGLSDGRPTFSSMTADAHTIFNFFLEAVRSSGQSEPLFVMGRSLGTQSAVELVLRHPEHLRGLIVESGLANVARLASLFGLSSERLRGLEEAISARVRSIALPALIIHGERDSLIPQSEAGALHEEIGSQEKRLVIIPGADHNDIMLVGMDQYFVAIRDFVTRNSG